MIAVTLTQVHSYPPPPPGPGCLSDRTGLTLPTIMGSGTADLPPAASATGSAVCHEPDTSALRHTALPVALAAGGRSAVPDP